MIAVTAGGADVPALICQTGVVVALSAASADATIQAISVTCEAAWGVRPEEVLGEPLARLLDASFLEILAPGERRAGPFVVRDTAENEWFATITRTDRQVMVHLEPTAPGDGDDATIWLARATERLDQMTEFRAMWAEGCATIRRRLGFDRVMVVRSMDAVDRVLTDSVADGLESLEGVVLPSADVPRPTPAESSVRSLVVHDTRVPPTMVVPRVDPDGNPWNLTLSPLLFPGERDLDILDRMSARASMVLFSTDIADARHTIWCINSEPARVDPLTRAALEQYVRILRTRINAEFEASRQALRQSRRALQSAVLERSEYSGLVDALATSEVDGVGLLGYVPADAAIIAINDETRMLGDLDGDEARAIDATVRPWLQALSRHGALHTDDVRRMHPQLANRAPRVAGLLATAIGTRGDYVCWVRRPQPITERWFDGIDASGPVLRVDESTHRSRRWELRDRDAAESMAQNLEDAMLRRAQEELAELALVDALTGLPNRRLLLDRLEKAIDRTVRGRHFTLLFLDLNDFKQVNDTFGHAVGDEVLIETARRLQGAVREGDTVSRLAGDEFVVLCEDTRLGEEQLLAERVRTAFEAPFMLDGQPVPVSAAVGVGGVELGLSADELLDRADRAMYVDKLEGKRTANRNT